MESVAFLFVTLALKSPTQLPVMKDPRPNTRHARTIAPRPADFAFLRVVKGCSRGDVLQRLGHPGKVERLPGGCEHWTYYRTDGKLFWVLFRDGRATSGMPTDGFHIGGSELHW